VEILSDGQRGIRAAEQVRGANNMSQHAGTITEDSGTYVTVTCEGGSRFKIPRQNVAIFSSGVVAQELVGRRVRLTTIGKNCVGMDNWQVEEIE
jgi:hypothetical protein